MADNSSQNNKDNIMKYKVCPPVADKDEIIDSKTILTFLSKNWWNAQEIRVNVRENISHEVLNCVTKAEEINTKKRKL